MTADTRRCCRGSNNYRRLKMTATTAVVIVAAVAAAVAVASASATTFESGETATVPPDDTVYMTEEVAPWNATAAAAGDYEYDEYDSTTADALQMPGGRYSPKPAKTVASRVDANITVPAATITVMVQAPTANVTNTTAATTAAAITATSTTSTAAAAAGITAAYSTTVVRPSTSATTVVAAADAATFPTTTTESGVLMQIASPSGYGATAFTTVTTTPTPSTTVTTTPAPTTTVTNTPAPTTIVTTTPAPTTIVTTTPASTTPNSSAPLLQYRRWTAALLLSLSLVATVAL